MRAFVIACAALVTLAGCASQTQTTTSSAAPTEAPAHDHSAKTVEVHLMGNKFVSGTLSVYEGDTVKWVNKEAVGHSVTSDTGQTPVFDNKPNCLSGALPSPVCMASGETFSVKFTATGKTTYHCRAHPNMTGTIVVVAHPAA